MTCLGKDPLCPCQDGLLCHYRDDPEGLTKASPIPLGVDDGTEP